MLNFFAIVLIIFIGLLILIFKNRKLNNTINTAGIAIPINGTKIGGRRLAKSDGINSLNIYKHFNIYLWNSVTFITGWYKYY